jgi:hypothetical protein
LDEKEIIQLSASIPHNQAIQTNEKFFKKLDKMLKAKLSEILNEQVTWGVLPSKGNDSAQIILKYLINSADIPEKIREAFDKLQYKETNQLNSVEIKLTDGILEKNSLENGIMANM